MYLFAVSRLRVSNHVLTSSSTLISLSKVCQKFKIQTLQVFEQAKNHLAEIEASQIVYFLHKVKRLWSLNQSGDAELSSYDKRVARVAIRRR